jgi:hypothetical protein
MNNYHVMSASFEARKNTQAAMITAGFAGLMLLLMFLLRWSLPAIELPVAEETIEVALNIPDDPPAKVLGGGGGGGNPVQATGNPGIAKATPPEPGVKEDSRDIETDEADKEAPVVKRPPNPKPVEKYVQNTSSIVKTEPKPIIETPAPRIAKATVGRTLAGNGPGGGAADNYDRSGGRGNGGGVGEGSGYGGGRGGGNGGGNGTGSGTGVGPRRVSGSRFVINPKNMDAGENLKGKVFAEISVSPDGIGTFVQTKRGSTYTTGEAIEIIREWLRRNRFDKKNEESLVVYEFNFIMGG